MENNEHLSYLLAPKGKVPQIGPEKGKAISDGIAIFQSTLPGPGVSYRFVYYEKGQSISALQIMKLNSGVSTVANVYTVPEKRRQGYGTKLMAKAQQLLGSVAHSDDLSNAGAGWADAMRKLPKESSRLQEAFLFWLNESKFLTNPRVST